MRLALLSDIHGNLHALKAVLDELKREQIDQYLCLGDVVEHGPHPKETLALIRELGCPVVMGNTDERMLDDYSQGHPSGDVWPGYEQDAWSAAQFTEDEQAAIRAFQPTVSLVLNSDIDLLAFHGTPQSHSGYLDMMKRDDEELLEFFTGFSATIMACGHSHNQGVRRARDKILVNPGSIGVPYEPTATGYRRPWRAEYAILEVTTAGFISVDLRQTTYDVKAHLRAYEESGMPHAALWIEEWNGEQG